MDSINQLSSQFDATSRSLTLADTLSPHCYSSPEWYEKENEKIFRKEWICVGREQKVANNGDYFTLTLGSEPVVVVRDLKGVVRAFLNVCRHRAAKVARGAGNTRTLVCGYHCWTYTLAGDLIVVPGKPDPMIGTENFDRKNYGLIPIRLERWAGFLFVNFSGEAPSLMNWLGDMPQFLANYSLEEMITNHELAFDVPVNWKVFVENTMESYHAGFVHSKFLPPNSEPQNWEFLETGGPYEAMYSNRSIMDFGNMPKIAGLDERQQTGLFHIWLHPNTTIHVASTYMTFRQYIPRGHDKMQILYSWCFHKNVIEDPSFPKASEHLYKQSIEILQEDIDFIPFVQEGLSARGALPGRYSPSEFIVHKVGRYIIDMVEGPRPKGKLIAAE